MRDEIKHVWQECKEHDWDGYGAHPVDESTAEIASKFLAAMPPYAPQPGIGADRDGSLTFDWYKGHRYVLSVSIAGDGKLDYAVLLGEEGRSGSEVFIDRIPDIILRLMDEVYRVGDQ